MCVYARVSVVLNPLKTRLFSAEEKKKKRKKKKSKKKKHKKHSEDSEIESESDGKF